jgi:3',5'-cyclic-AMP phosphodiesterase
MSRHRIAHLSDTHLTGSGFDEDGVDAASALDRMLHDLRLVPDVDLVVVSGDIADDGSVAGCAGVLERVGRFAAERGVPQVYCTGNHDARGPFGEVFGSGHLGADGRDQGEPIRDAGDERAAVSVVGGLRVITLDSLVPGEVLGRISEAQLAWLRSVLAEPAPDGSIVVLHHPPVALDWFPQMAAINLQNAADLARAIQGRDVRAVLCGHYHLQLSATLAGVPVWVTPGIVTRLDLTAGPAQVRAVTGAGAGLVELTPDGHSFHALHARDPRAGTEVYAFAAGPE